MTDRLAREGRRERRRKRRLIMILGFVLFSTGMAWFFELQATTTVIVVRHTETNSTTAGDPGLNARGNKRALELARVLKDVDVVAGVDAIFVGPDRRSRDTSAPLGMFNGAPVHTIETPVDTEQLEQRILTEFKGKIILVVTDAQYMQPIIAEMHGSKKLPPLDEAGYNNIYIVTIPWFGKVKTLRIKYGLPSTQPPATTSF
jgi:phosphohistidine phosphatase SixA